jgi:hypothetical protein
MHLKDAGLDPAQNHAPKQAAVTTALGGKVVLPVRRAHLWLVSNLPAFQGTPYRMPLDPGIPFQDVEKIPDPKLNMPLLGMRAMRAARLRVEIDFDHGTVSVRTSDT